MKLSICLIVKNEERVLGRCLACAVQIAEELIVVDTGSDDRSVEIARQYTPHVYLHPWQNSFAEARNFSYSRATGDYIMWLDADDVIIDESIARLNALKAEGTDADVILTRYGSASETGLTEYILRDRIIRRAVFTQWLYDVHEVIPMEPGWKVLYRPDIEILHQKEYVNEPDRNIAIFTRLLEAGQPLSLFEKVNLVKELCLHRRTDEALRLFQEILDKVDGNGCAYALNFLVQSLLQEERWQECLEVIRQAGPHISPTAKLTYEEGLCMEELGDEEGAESLYRQALTVEEDPYGLSIRYTGYHDYYPYLQLAMLADRRGDSREALRLIDNAGRAYPKDEAWQDLRLRVLLNVQKQGSEKEPRKPADANRIRELKEKVLEIRELLQSVSPEELEELFLPEEPVLPKKTDKLRT